MDVETSTPELDRLAAEISASIDGMTTEQKAELSDEVIKATGKWEPAAENIPQQLAKQSLADVLLYGGQAGGGKTDLGLGLAMTEHTRSLVMRRHYTDLGYMTERACQINGTRKGFNGSPPPKLRTTDGRLIDFGAAARAGNGIDPGDEDHWQGHPHDLLYLDEVVQFAESQVRFLMGWIRSVEEGQRTRIIFGSNPPLGVQGEWVIGMFAPWLDERYPNPAKHGELRWVVTDEDGKDLWIDGPDVEIPDGKGGLLEPQSRTFIPAQLSDNPYLAGTGYKANLDALPEPLRSAVRDGNFMAARQDEVDQLIPTIWVRQAQERWEDTAPYGIPMCAIGVDCARAKDETVLACRHDGWYAPLICVPGSETPHGTDIASLVLKHRRDNALIIVDIGEGTGGQAYAHLKNNLAELDEIHTSVVAYRGMDPSAQRTAEKQLGFFNKRAEAYWRFREALDPGQEGGSPIALPDDPKLVSDLTAVTWELIPRGIKLLPKDKVIDKLQRSPDRGDAVVMAWTGGATAVTHINIWRKDHRVGDFPRHRLPKYDMGPKYRNRRR